MKLKSLLSSLLIFSTINVITPNLINLNIKTNFFNDIKNSDDEIAKIAKKYQSPTIDPSTINFESFFNDINNSSIMINLRNVINNLYFSIDQMNSPWVNHIKYQGQSGSGASSAYQNNIRSNVIKMLSYIVTLELIKDVAHYYGDNTEMDSFLRESAVVKTISILIVISNVEFSFLSFNEGIFKDIKNWANDYYAIISDVVEQKYTDDLFTKYNNIDFNNLKLDHNTLTEWDNHAAASGTHNISDGFSLLNQSNNKVFTFSMNISSYSEWATNFYHDIHLYDSNNFVVTLG